MHVALRRVTFSTSAAAGSLPSHSSLGEFLDRARRRLLSAEYPLKPADEKWIDFLKDTLRVPGGPNVNSARGTVVLRSLGYKDAYSLLTDLGAIPPMDPPSMAAITFQRNHTDHELEMARLLVQDFQSNGLREKILAEPDRRDFRSNVVYTMDSISTTDVDDGISFESNGDGTTWIHTHISDPTSMVPFGSPLDLMARGRGLTVYTPSFKAHMFPKALSTDLFSLEPGHEKEGIPAVTFSGKINDADATLLDFKVTPSILGRIEKVNYDQADKLINSRDVIPGEQTTAGNIRHLYELTLGMRARRVDNGAISMNSPSTNFTKRDDGTCLAEIEFHHLSPSMMLVQEVMLLGNHVAAEYCRINNVPIPFRVQPNGADRNFSAEHIAYFKDVMLNNKIFANHTIHFGRILQTRTATTAGEIWSLGLPSYTRVTSPIRRYVDIVAHHQIKAHLRGQPLPMNVDEMEAMIQKQSNMNLEVTYLQISTEQFFTIQHYESMPQDTLIDALATKDEGQGIFQIVLLDTGFSTKIKLAPDRVPNPGEAFKVRLVIADSKKNMLYFSVP